MSPASLCRKMVPTSAAAAGPPLIVIAPVTVADGMSMSSATGAPGGTTIPLFSFAAWSAGGDRVTIGNTSGPSFSARVVPGTYDLFYVRTATPNNTSTAAPANQACLLYTSDAADE